MSKKKSLSIIRNVTSNVSEYKIGHTLYIVETHFCCERSETLDDIIKRLISRDITKKEHIA